MPETPIHFISAPQITEDSWLMGDEFEDFRKAYAYALTQTRAIIALANITPEDAYWLWSILDRAFSYNEVGYPFSGVRDDGSCSHEPDGTEPNNGESS